MRSQKTAWNQQPGLAQGMCLPTGDLPTPCPGAVPSHLQAGTGSLASLSDLSLLGSSNGPFSALMLVARPFCTAYGRALSQGCHHHSQPHCCVLDFFASDDVGLWVGSSLLPCTYSTPVSSSAPLNTLRLLYALCPPASLELLLGAKAWRRCSPSTCSSLKDS